MADAIARYKNGKSVLFYTWTPNWTVGALKLGKDVVLIEVPYSKTKATKVNNATNNKYYLSTKSYFFTIFLFMLYSKIVVHII